MEEEIRYGLIYLSGFMLCTTVLLTTSTLRVTAQICARMSTLCLQAHTPLLPAPHRPAPSIPDTVSQEH